MMMMAKPYLSRVIFILAAALCFTPVARSAGILEGSFQCDTDRNLPEDFHKQVYQGYNHQVSACRL